MLHYNPERLRFARERRGLTKKALADAADLDSKTITVYESDSKDSAPTLSSLEKLAFALGYPISFFQKDDAPTLKAEAVSFRAATKLSKKKENAAIRAGELAKELNQWLEGQFSLPANATPAFEPEEYGNPTTAAAMLRQQWQLGERSITNMVHLLESKGIRVFSLAENCLDVDAFSFWEDDTPYILLNTMKSPERSRFDAAHELGHLVMHKFTENKGPEAEQQANQFASEFLMPEASVKSILRPWPTLHQLIQQKKNWKVSLAALVRRSYDLGFSTDWHYRQLSIQLAKQGFRTQEPESMEARETSLLLEKIFNALRARGMSLKEVLEQLGWPLDELKALTFGRGLGMHIASNKTVISTNNNKALLRVVK